MMSNIKKSRNLTLIFFFLFSIFLIFYVINIFGVFGLIFWEIAYYLVLPCVIGIIWAVRRINNVKKERIPKYKHKLLVFSLIVFISFSVFAIIPFLYVTPLGAKFDKKFKNEFGDDYWNDIPENYRQYLKKQGNYFDISDLKYFRNKDVEIKKDICYGDKDDKWQIMDKYEDKSIREKNKPALIFVHGGGSTNFSRKDDIYCIWICRYYATIGFVAFSLEYTSATVEPFPKGVLDVRTAIVHIKQNTGEYNIDNSSIVLMGQSRGGHLVTICAYAGINDAEEGSWWRANGGNFTAEQLRVACVIDLYGAVDQFYAFEHNGFLASRNKIIFGGTPEEKKELYEVHTSKNYVSKDCPPTLIMHGSLDQMVQVGESKELHNALDEAGAFNIYLEVPFGQHGFDIVPGTAGNLLAYYFIPRFIFLVLYG